ncbi:glycosyltransferase family 2 protein [Pedobacter sp. MR22-3]|uniref:glycosyltransferase family 2 protein n=1 Tax=Pedobacter sp. MR22-3 TaxID=2994552 RepID=UPI00224511F1|nr:glycosyltransferase family 2 protein [Pedobacter sp. MR22-3]MCX2582895.1 glycosyltransferase family 2 protein [Pedobacter sp. MR22-3]
MLNEEVNRVLSICIPTRGRAEILMNTLTSIFESEVDQSLYEVVIYDSSNTDETELFIKSKFQQSNLIYIRGVNYGYLNLIEALKMGNGDYLKLHNDYSSFKLGSLEAIIDEIKKATLTKPVLLFSNGTLDQKVQNFANFDSFLYTLSFYSTWSTIFGIWRSDFDLLNKRNVNSMFPHTSLLFEFINKDGYRIVNHPLFTNIEVGNKGGYNLFQVFAIVYLDMVKELLDRQYIEFRTFEKIKRDLFYKFLVHWYSETKVLRNNYTFILTDIKKSIRTYYSNFDYNFLIFLSYLRSIFSIVKKTIKRLFNLK